MEERDIRKFNDISEEWMRIILDNVEEGIHILDWGGTFLYLSPSWERVIGITREEALGKKFTPYVHPDDIPQCLAFLQKVYQTGQPQKLLQFRVKHASGEWMWFTNSGVSIKDKKGRPLCFLGLGTDISERKQMEESLAASEQRLRAILDNTEEVIYTLDWEGNFLFLSTAWENVTGHTVEEAVGQPFAPYVHEDDRPGCFEFLKKVRDTGQPHKGGEYRVRSKSGEWVWFRSTGAAIKDADGAPLHYVGAAMDVTELKRNEEQRREHERHMQQVQKFESLGVLAGGVAHDFNNILLAIMGYAELSLMDLEPGSALGANMKGIINAAARAADLCKQMLASAGKGLTVIEEIDLGAIIQEMLHLLEISISKKIALELNLKPDLPMMKGDNTQIRQIIMNLIINGAEAIGSLEGAITVETGVKDTLPPNMPRNPFFDPDHDGPWILLKVTDSGCGMDAATIDRMFEPFFTTKFTGRGLGMSAVQGIIRSHRGYIAVDSRPGQGACFRLFFPACSHPAAITEKRGDAPEWVQGRSCRILLVDDEEEVVKVCTRIVKKLGHAVITARDGSDALAVFKEKEAAIDLIIMDMTMPHMDGKETLAALRLLDTRVPVVISSGYTEVDILGQFSGLHLNGFIQKPYTMKKLADCIEHAMKI